MVCAMAHMVSSSFRLCSQAWNSLNYFVSDTGRWLALASMRLRGSGWVLLAFICDGKQSHSTYDANVQIQQKASIIFYCQSCNTMDSLQYGSVWTYPSQPTDLTNLTNLPLVACISVGHLARTSWSCNMVTELSDTTW